MKTYVIYEILSGRIVRLGACPDIDFDRQYVPMGHKILDTNLLINSKEYYILNDKITPRPKLDISIDKTQVNADGVDTVKITNIPTGATIMISGATYTIDDGIAELTFQNPGIYQIRISRFPYKDVTLEVEAI